MSTTQSIDNITQVEPIGVNGGIAMGVISMFAFLLKCRGGCGTRATLTK